MKRSIYFLSLMLLMSFTVFTACKDDDAGGTETTEQIKTRQLTSGNFTVNSVERGGESEQLDGTVTLKFNENGSFSITGGSLPNPMGTTMPSSGNWSFTDKTNFDEITLTSGSTENVVLTVTTLNDNNLVFQYSGAGLKESDPAVTVVVTASR